ncbi:MAG: bis-aminopropyl spermidine synthase family protein [Vulcanimicrobiota bacterium]
MTHYLSPDIWLQRPGDRTLASNVRTGRRALLETEECEELGRFADGQELDLERHQRLLDADLIEAEARPSTSRMEPLLNALDRYLLLEMGFRKTEIREAFPDGPSRLKKIRSHLSEQVVEGAYLPHVLRRDLNAMLDHVATFLAEESEPSPGPFRFSPGFVEGTAGRPLPREDYEQQPCMPITSQKRIETARELLSPGSRTLILGDDDLLSLYWSMHMEQPCDVFELDQALLDFLKPRLAGHLTLHARDLTLGLPTEFHGKYEVVFTDPMYEENGMNLFMKCCADALSDSPGARVLFTTRPDMIDAGDRFEERLAAVGLEIEKVEKDFSRYRLPDFYRRKLITGFGQHGISANLVMGLTQIPYLYADLFFLKKS